MMLQAPLGVTTVRECFMAMIAAMKKVLSPISDARIMPHDFKNPSTTWLSANSCILSCGAVQGRRTQL